MIADFHIFITLMIDFIEWCELHGKIKRKRRKNDVKTNTPINGGGNVVSQNQTQADNTNNQTDQSGHSQHYFPEP